MSAMTLRAAKRAAFLDLITRLRGITIAGAPPRVQRNADAVRITAQLGMGAIGQVHIGTVKQGLPVGQFALWPSASVSGGPLRQLLNALPLPSSHQDGLGTTVSATCSIAGTGRLSFPIRDASDRNIAVVADIVEAHFIPLLEAFGGQWRQALEFTLTYPQFVARPFSAAVALASLAAGHGNIRSDQLDAIKRAAEANKSFWDFRAAPQVDELVCMIIELARRIHEGDSAGAIGL